MPLPLTVSCFSEIQIGFTFLVPAHPGSLGGKRAVKQVCVCVCVLLGNNQILKRATLMRYAAGVRFGCPVRRPVQLVLSSDVLCCGAGAAAVNSTAIIAVVVIVVLVAIAVVIAICIVLRRKNKKPPKGSHITSLRPLFLSFQA